ncbi:hypothetical protein [Methylosinus sp. PW1]|uniref:hypothetical protein n=1 Tax=Methylosinus sp. PW1 TaxID=107636 RepID=UPI000689DE79|nr:hypothetical protein [Methylosinus sp. PW1]
MAQCVSTALLLGLLVPTVFAGSAMAEESLISLNAPSDGQKLEVGKSYKAEYEVKAGVKGAHHVHLFIDGDEAATGHKLKGGFAYGPLKAGEHKICVAPVNKNHTPIGAQACVSITAQ